MVLISLFLCETGNACNILSGMHKTSLQQVAIVKEKHLFAKRRA